MKREIYSLGLIGYPLSHSLSPQIHGAVLDQLSVNGEYKLYPVLPLPGGETQLKELLSSVRDGKIHGLNVTIPHKQNVIPLLDELTPAAQTIGAVNTIFCREGRLMGDNTDAPGFWADLQKLVITNEENEKYAFVLGAGGSARAVVYALLAHGYHVTIAARRLEQAQELSNQLSVFSDRLSALDISKCLQITDRCSLIVNTTPVGMTPDIDSSPWPADSPLPKNAAVYDLVYNPRKTLLVQQALEAGLPAITGLGMLVEQAALAFERWTDLKAPRAVMWSAVEKN